MEKFKEEHITLLKEEIDSLDNFKEVCVYENEDKKIKIFISIPFIKEFALKQNILERYNNEEYWEEDIQRNPDIPENEEE